MSTTSFLWQTEEQRKLHQKINNLLGPGPAALYYDVHRMLAEPSPYISTTHLVAHLLREIESSLRRVLLPYNYASASEEERHKQQIEAIIKTYALAPAISTQWITLATGSKEQDHGFAAFAHRDALALPRLLDEACKQMMVMFEQVMISVLDAFERQSLHVYKFLDSLLAKQQPGKDDVSKLKNKIPANWATYSYFFSRLEDPAWLRPLSQKNVFAIPTEDAEEEYLRYSPWPQAIYLKKMASQGQDIQEQVLSILMNVANTNNLLAQQAMLEIAQLLPAHFSMQLTPFITTWIVKFGKYSFFSIELQQFIKHLAQNGQMPSAMVLFQTLLLEMSTNGLSIQRWDYEQLLFDLIPTFIMNAPQELLDLLCNLLDQDIYQRYIRFRKLDAEDATVYDRVREASTRTWLPTFEVNEHAHVQETQSLILLAIALRKAAEQAINEGYFSFSETLSLLDAHAGQIFKRLTLYLLSQFASNNLSLAHAKLMTRTLFKDTDLLHEYSLLAQATLPHLTQEEQALWFQWLEEGPDLEVYKQWYQRAHQVLPGDNDIQQFKATWQRNWLGRIEKVLPNEWHVRYDKLVAQYGVYEPELNFLSWPAAMRPPLQDTDRNMTVEQWLQRLDTSQDDQGNLQIDALCSNLTSLITEAPEHFADQAHLFEGQTQEVVKAVISGLVRAAQMGHPFDWHQVLHLCTWIIEQRQPFQGEETDERTYDPVWAPVTFEVAMLFLTTFEKSPSQIPYASRETIWQLLVVLTDDPYVLSKSAKDTPQRYLSDALNSTQGIALLAIISYAWWVMKHDKEKEEQQEGILWNLSDAPEIQALLELHLSGQEEHDPIIHTVCAHSLTWLAQLDEQWTVQHLKDIFPHRVEDQVHYEVAWTTYLFQRRRTRQTFKLMKDEYVFAIEQLQRTDEQKISIETANYYLAQHLFIAYWNEDITLEDDSLLVVFFQRASGLLRQSFITQVGQICTREQQPIDPLIIQRFQRLWEWRTTPIKQAPLDSEAMRELAGFAWWMACESFSPIWAVQHLAYILEHVESIEMSFVIVIRLTECIAEAPLVTLRCLDHLVRDTGKNWGGKEWMAVKELLSVALQQEQQELHQLAMEIISYLAIHGHMDLLKLLP